MINKVKYFKPIIEKMTAEYDIDYKSASNVKDKATIKKVDQMRISHMDKNIGTAKKDIYEFVLLNLVETMLKNIKKKQYFLRSGC